MNEKWQAVIYKLLRKATEHELQPAEMVSVKSIACAPSDKKKYE